MVGVSLVLAQCREEEITNTAYFLFCFLYAFCKDDIQTRLLLQV
jgi:hypothetical protein